MVADPAAAKNRSEWSGFMAYRLPVGRAPWPSNASVSYPPISRWRPCPRLLALLLCALLAGCAAISTVAYVPPSPAPVVYAPPPPPAPPSEKSKTIVANASWYGPGFDGHKTATGERFSSLKMTAAAKGLPLGSKVEVTNLSNGRSAVVRINDCGPYWKNRKLDLSKSAARRIGIIHDGTARVKVKVVEKPQGAPVCPSSAI
jgi:rare lipoprotein A